MGALQQACAQATELLRSDTCFSSTTLFSLTCGVVGVPGFPVATPVAYPESKIWTEESPSKRLSGKPIETMVSRGLFSACLRVTHSTYVLRGDCWKSGWRATSHNPTNVAFWLLRGMCQ